jgi:peptidoglycan/xylan/chitin deacetylase (PgdA/CDA1 family)
MKSGANKILILTFHALEETNTPISFAPRLFTQAIKKWYAQGWRTISLSDAVQHLKQRDPFPAKSFILTFDDGYASVYRIAFPLLQECGMTATIFVAPNETITDGTTLLPMLYKREMLRWNEIREMHAYGIDFGAHTLTHRDLTQLDEIELDRELRVSQQILTDALGERIGLFAYPKGKYNLRVRERAAQYYDAACSDHLGIAAPNSDLFALPRVETYYLRSKSAMDALTHAWFPSYLQLRNVPRVLRRVFIK